MSRGFLWISQREFVATFYSFLAWLRVLERLWAASFGDDLLLVLPHFTQLEIYEETNASHGSN